MLPQLLRASFPSAKTLYDIIGCPSDAPAAALKRAYYKAALQHHPDKAGASPESTARFQALTIAHAVLSDPAKRREYDATGEVDLGEGGGGGGGGGASFATWESHWRAQFPAFTERDIDAFAGRYRSSKEEEEDVLAAYEESKGSMDGILERVPCSELGDEARFVGVIHAAIAAGRVKPLKAFTRMYGKEAEAAEGGGGGGAAAAAARSARASRAAGEAAEAEAHLAELRAEFAKKTGAAGEPSLADMLRQRQKERASAADSFADSLAAKYGSGGGGGGGKMLEDKGAPKRKRGGK